MSHALNEEGGDVGIPYLKNWIRLITIHVIWLRMVNMKGATSSFCWCITTPWKRKTSQSILSFRLQLQTYKKQTIQKQYCYIDLMLLEFSKNIIALLIFLKSFNNIVLCSSWMSTVDSPRETLIFSCLFTSPRWRSWYIT